MGETNACARSGEQPCNWCCGGSELDVGSGIFADFDSDFGDGVPVCGGCGGVGRQINSPNFKEQANSIMELRFAYYKASAPDRLSILKTLIEKVKEHFSLYGRVGDRSFAARISLGELDNALAKLQAQLN